MANETPLPGEVWRHCRGAAYAVVAVATREESSLPYVVYAAESDGRVWCRPLFHWNGMVRNAEHPGGVRRFTKEAT